MSGNAAYVLMLRKDGSVWIMGSADAKESGTGKEIKMGQKPVEIKTLNNIVDIYSYDYSNLALDADGNMWCWSGYDNTWLWYGDERTTDLPIKLDDFKNIKSICYGYMDEGLAAIDNNDELWAIGSPTIMGIERGENAFIKKAAMVENMSDVKKALCLGSLVVALKNDGTVWTWGRREMRGCQEPTGEYNSLLGEEIAPDMYKITPSPILSGVREFAATRSAAYAVMNDGGIYQWGYGYEGIVIKNEDRDEVLAPEKIEGVTDVDKVFINFINGYIVKKDGTVFQTGNNVDNDMQEIEFNHD